MPPTPSHHRTAVQYFLLNRTGLIFATGLCTVFCVLVLVLFPKDQVTSNCECLPDGTVCCIEASSSCGMGQCYCGPAVGSGSSNPDENYCTAKITTETASPAGLFASGAMLVITSCFLLFLLYGYRVDTREWKEHAQEHHPEQEQGIVKQQQEHTNNNNNHTATSTNRNDGHGGDMERQLQPQHPQVQPQHPQQEQKQPETSDVDAVFITDSTPSSLPRIMEHSSSELRMTMDEEEDHNNHNHSHAGNSHSELLVVPELPIPIQLQQSIQTQQHILSLPSLDHGPLVEERQRQQLQQSPRQQAPPTQTPPPVIPVPTRANQPQTAPQPTTTTSSHDHADPNTAEWVLEEDETSC